MTEIVEEISLRRKSYFQGLFTLLGFIVFLIFVEYAFWEVTKDPVFVLLWGGIYAVAEIIVIVLTVHELREDVYDIRRLETKLKTTGGG